MRRSNLWIVALVGCLAVTAPALAAKPGGDPNAPPCVTLADEVVGADTNFRSDLEGPQYCNGESGLSVTVAQSFNFSINPKKADGRHLVLVIAPQGQGLVCPGMENTCNVVNVSTANTSNLPEYTEGTEGYEPLSALDFCDATGCINAVIEGETCGRTSRCSYCTFFQTMQETIRSGRSTEPILFQRTFIVNGRHVEKSLKISTR